MASTSGIGLEGHPRGLQKLVEILGPEHFQTEPELQVFEQSRMIIAYTHLETKERCFLEQPSWQTVPWVQHPSKKSARSQLADIFCMLPGILQDIGTLLSDPHHSPSEILLLYQNIDNRLNELVTPVPQHVLVKMLPKACSFEKSLRIRFGAELALALFSPNHSD